MKAMTRERLAVGRFYYGGLCPIVSILPLVRLCQNLTALRHV